jgi:hypothetical protein
MFGFNDTRRAKQTLKPSAVQYEESGGLPRANEEPSLSQRARVLITAHINARVLITAHIIDKTSDEGSLSLRNKR